MVSGEDLGGTKHLGNVVSDVFFVFTRVRIFKSRLILIWIRGHQALYGDQD